MYPNDCMALLLFFTITREIRYSFYFLPEKLFLTPMNNAARTVLICILFFSRQFAFAQTQEEWARTVNWDGVSHWSKYIITQPGHMGPNALPVPFISNGSTDSITFAGTSFSYHTMKGDRVKDWALFGNYCLVKDRVSIDISYKPVEWFTTSDTLKKQRHVYYQNYYDRHARGDVHLNVNIRLLKRWEKAIQLALRIGTRYPASSGLGAARFTDGMGYFFDVSYGKPLSPSLKWIGMAGFYVWQLNGDSHRQNDAFLFGNGLEWNRDGWRLQGYVAGYLGYLFNSGDKPIVLRSHVEKRVANASFLFRFQQGIQDFKYSSFELGGKYFLKYRKPVAVK